jgi:NAD(P)H dehydrogenase (quinone)
MTKLLITGGSGHLGTRVLELLVASVKTSDIIATTRAPEKLERFKGITVRKSSFDDSVEQQAKAFEGADHILIISGDALGRRVEQHTRAIAAAKKAGVKHVSYTSLTRTEPGNPITIAPEHWATEQALGESGLAYTVLRNNWYAEYLLPALQAATHLGQLFGATNNQRFGAITRDDCARAAAASLKQGGTQKRTLEISGSGVTFDELAHLTGEVAGKPVKHVNVPAADFEKGLEPHVPKGMAHLVRTFHDAIAQGFSLPPSDYETLTGQKLASVADFLASALRGQGTS